MIVQCGARRSGNHLLWRILNRLLGREAEYEAFLGSVGALAPPLGYTHAEPRDASPLSSGSIVVQD